MPGLLIHWLLRSPSHLQPYYIMQDLMGPCFPGGGILSTCAIPMLRNDKENKFAEIISLWQIPFCSRCYGPARLHPSRHPESIWFTTRIRSRCSFLELGSPGRIDDLRLHLQRELTFQVPQDLVGHFDFNSKRVRAEFILFNIVNIMVADALAPCIARSSAPMILTM